MLLRRQSLSKDAKKQFSLFSNIFCCEVNTEEEMFLTPDIRYVRAAMMDAALNQGFVAISGESGSGKSTILNDFKERTGRDRKDVILIEPSVITMDDNDEKGKATLKTGGILTAMILKLNPLARPKPQQEEKFRQLQKLLETSAASGNTHLVMIEEAHSIPLSTLRHLKRINEMRHGRKKMVGILLVGQPELKHKLSENFYEVREIAQRCELAELEPLGTNLKPYLEHKAKMGGRPLSDFIDESGIEAIRARLTVTRGVRKGQDSLLYPLAVNNVMTAALNVAAELGVPVVTADVVRGV